MLQLSHWGYVYQIRMTPYESSLHLPGAGVCVCQWSPYHDVGNLHPCQGSVPKPLMTVTAWIATCVPLELLRSHGRGGASKLGRHLWVGVVWGSCGRVNKSCSTWQWKVEGRRWMWGSLTQVDPWLCLIEWWREGATLMVGVLVVKRTWAVMVAAASKGPPIMHTASCTASGWGILVPPIVGTIGGNKWLLGWCRLGTRGRTAAGMWRNVTDIHSSFL